MSPESQNRSPNDSYFRDLLGVSKDATREQIRRTYRRIVMENHPDRFPAERKSLQELKLITMTEAYTFLMGGTEEDAASAEPPPRRSSPRPARAATATHTKALRRAVGNHKDPAYAYYKQGFINFSLAIHGIAEVNRKIAEEKLPRFRPYRVSQDFANSLSLLGAAHGYFMRVVEGYPQSVWVADAEAKLLRIQRFTRLYKRILSNMRIRGGVEP
jgi:hypothetical protein